MEESIHETAKRLAEELQYDYEYIKELFNGGISEEYIRNIVSFNKTHSIRLLSRQLIRAHLKMWTKPQLAKLWEEMEHVDTSEG